MMYNIKMKSINKKILSIFSAVLIFTFVFSFASINKVFAYSLSVTGISGTSASVGGAGFNGGTIYDLHLIKGLVNINTIHLSTNSAGVFGTNLTNLDPSTQYTVSIFPQNSNIASIIDQSFTTTTAPSTLPVLNFSANPTTITLGQSTTLTWTSTNTASCTAGGNGWSGPKPVNGTATYSPTVNASYSLFCTGTGGTTSIINASIIVNPVNTSGQTGLSGNSTGQNGLSGNSTGQTGLSGNSTGQNLVSSDGKIKNPISYNNINDFIRAILQGAIKIGIPIIALAIIYSGFLFVSARGNSEKLSEAKNALLYTCIGAAILLGAWAIAQLISETILAL